MGEIKSTMDLVMEKTKHLSMTEDEKNREKINQIRKKIKSRVQKYLDGFLNQNMFAKELDQLDNSRINLIQLLKQELLERIHIDGKHRQIIKLLKSFCGVSGDKLVSIIDDYHQKLKDELQRKIAERKGVLLNDFKISGTAVLPNLDSDTQWNKQALEIRARYQELLESEKQNLAGPL